MEPLSFALALAQFAPSILRYFGVGDKPLAVAEKVVAMAQSITATSGQPPEATLARLRENDQLAHQFSLRMLEMDGELEQAYLGDRQNARSHDIEVRKLTGGSNQRADLMIAGAVLGLIACLTTLIFFRDEIPGEVVGIVSTVAGIFGACLRDAFQFEFGSSRGSREKDQALAERFKAAG